MLSTDQFKEQSFSIAKKLLSWASFALLSLALFTLYFFTIPSSHFTAEELLLNSSIISTSTTINSSSSSPPPRGMYKKCGYIWIQSQYKTSPTKYFECQESQISRFNYDFRATTTLVLPGPSNTNSSFNFLLPLFKFEVRESTCKCHLAINFWCTTNWIFHVFLLQKRRGLMSKLHATTAMEHGSLTKWALCTMVQAVVQFLMPRIA